jgi:hypothetical protein
MVAAMRAVAGTCVRSRITIDNSPVGSICGPSSVRTSSSCISLTGLNSGTFDANSEGLVDRLVATRTKGRTRTISRSATRVVVETRKVWRAVE